MYEVCFYSMACAYNSRPYLIHKEITGVVDLFFIIVFTCLLMLMELHLLRMDLLLA